MSSSIPSLPSATASASAVPSGNSTLGTNNGTWSAPLVPLPADVAPRPSSGPQPPAGQPFFFNPTHSDEAQVCYFTATAPGEKTGFSDMSPPDLRKFGESMCTGVGIWNKDLFACRTETANSTAVFESRVKGNETSWKGKCRPYAEYEERIRSAFLAEPQWPQRYDNSTHSVATAYGAFNSTAAGDYCCTSAGGEPIASTGLGMPSGYPPDSFFEYRSDALSPCLVPKDKADAYKQCVLSADSNALPMVESYQYWEPKSDSGTAARKTGLGFALLAAATALVASVA